MHNPIGWFEIYVSDIERAIAFYQNVFKVTLEPVNDPNGSDIVMWSFGSAMQSYGATGALVKMDGIKVGGNSTLVYFSCQDCSVEAKRAEMAGGQLKQAKMAIGEYGFISLVADTEGNIIGLHSSQ
ncbi:VOC family protein [Vibrio sp. 404]|uniref:VOC family protein n=1 Tax=Vibrio marinisediminis TaxID=2758441 RepID=A0A7W2FTH7_9VIBR|nr:VOC family protein [Vibrio marinisediminis]MBA5763976.1 VOC family protein [Vibrio marinisediminis]